MSRTAGIGVVLAAAVVAALVSSAPAPPPAERFTLRIGAGHPAGPTVYATVMQSFLVPEVTRRVADETRYDVRFVEGYGGSIARVAETLEAVQAGVLDIGAYCVCFEPAKLFLHNFSYFVPFGPTDAERAIGIAREIYEEHAWLARQFEERYGQRLLALNGWDNYHLGTVNPWQTIDDLRGVKIGGAGPNLPWLEYVGAVPVQSTMPDGYMGLQTGIYSGWLMFPSAYYAYRFHEPAPHYTLVGFGAMGGTVVLTISSRTLRRLPPEVAAIIFDVARAYETVAARALDERQIRGLENLRRAGTSVRELPEEVRKRWAYALRAFPDRMAKDADRRGMPGSPVIRAYIETARRHGHQWPIDYVID